MKTRLLTPEDHLPLHDFLNRYSDYTLFMLSNLERSGIIAGDEPSQGQYWGTFDGAGELVGAMALYWNGILMPCAPEGLETLAEAARSQANRPIGGFIGERNQVNWLAAWFGACEYQLDSPEILYAVALAELVEPSQLRQKDICCRLAEPADAEFLVDWRVQYSHEAMREPITEASQVNASKQMLRQIENRACYVLFHGRQPVAMSAFNAKTEQYAQVGGVYTPPEYRGRGYGRAVVAGSLLDARKQGLQRSILFTGFDNLAAQGAYEAIGYREIGEFAIKILKK